MDVDGLTKVGMEGGGFRMFFGGFMGLRWVNSDAAFAEHWWGWEFSVLRDGNATDSNKL